MVEKKWVVEPDQSSQRLDLFLASAGAGLSRTAVQKALQLRPALVNGHPAKASQLVEAGDQILFFTLETAPYAIEAETIPLHIIYEDADLVVVNKPRGMVVHPAPGNSRGTLVHALLAQCSGLSGIGGVMRPGIVHRLDKDTTGLLVVAKHDRAHLSLAAQLKNHTVSRTYLALVHGTMPSLGGSLEMRIGRHPVERKKMAVVPNGRPATTHYQVLENCDDFSLLLLKLATGRTHQIRVHLSSIGHPVVGDPVYGRRQETLGLLGQALHAGKLAFEHPSTRELLQFKADPPADFLSSLAQARLRAGLPPDEPIYF